MNSRLKLIVVFSIIILHFRPAALLSQPAFIESKIINSATLKPVPFATILLKYNQLGVYANADGDFRIMLNPEFEKDSLIVTCIGFKRYSVPFSQFLTNPVNRVYLSPIIYGLSEVKITASARKLGSLAIIGRAIRNIRRNYPAKAFNYIAYYRDYQKRDSNYLNLNEAIVQVLDNGFTSQSIKNKYRLLDFKKNQDFTRMNLSPYYGIAGKEENSMNKIIPQARLGDQYGNELFVLMVHDALRNYKTRSFSFIEVFEHDFVLNHNFGPPTPVYDNNLLLMKIIFNGKTKITGNTLLVSGAIYIQPRTYAIHKIEYSCRYEANGKPQGEMFNVDIEYGKENDVDSLMCLKYISFNNFFEVTDVDDDSYFKVVRANWETTHYLKPTLIIEFNNNVDPRTAVKKENYRITAGKKPVKITNIQASGKTVYVRTIDPGIREGKDSLWISVTDVKDADGNIIDKKKILPLYQYRELFIQEYNKPLQFKDSCYMEYLPLDQNCRSEYSGKDKYWMNTPAKIK